MNKNIAVVSFWADQVIVHEFEGDYTLGDGRVAWCGNSRESLDGFSVEHFLDDVLTHHHRASNKVTVVKRLNTWYWAAVLGQDGELRGQPRKIRHTLPTGKPAVWAIQRDERYTGDRKKYVLVPVKDGQ